MSIIILTAISRSISPSGVCRGAVSTANALARLDHIKKIYFIVGNWQTNYYTKQLKLDSQKIQIVSIDIINSSWQRNKWFISQLPKLSIALKANWVVLSYPMPILKILFKKDCKLLVIVHDMYVFSNPDNFGYPNVYGNQLFMRLCIANIHQIVFISQQTKNAFYDFFPNISVPSQIIHWYAALDRSNQNRPSSVLPDEKYILSIAQHRKNKNLILLIETFIEILNKQSFSKDTKLIIVGIKGPETPQINEIMKGYETNIKLISGLSDPELAYLYEHCQFVVSTSTAEGFGYTIIESIHFGKEIICSDIPIFREVGNDNCIFFNIANLPHENLSHAMKNVFSKKKITPKINDKAFTDMVEAYKTIIKADIITK